MHGFRNFLLEDKEGKNLHLNHVEDEILTGGVTGARGAINFLRSLRDMLSGHSQEHIDVTVKWDGAPSLFCGINPENGKFFVGTKGVFAQNAKLNYTNADIDKNHPSEGLSKKLKVALKYLPDLGIKGILQGDMLFTKGDISKETIDGSDYIVFQPNTIAYAVPADSNLARIMLAAQIGVVFHTTYSGKKMEDMKASFGASVGHLKPNKNVWYRDASFTDASGTATFTSEETKEITEILSRAGTIFNGLSAQLLNKIAMTETLRIPIMTYNNSKVREGQKITDTRNHVIGLIKWIEDKANKEILAAKKSDTKRKRELEKAALMKFYRGNATQLKAIFDLQNLMVEAKNMIVRKLESVQDIGTFLKTDDGYKITAPEGFVAIDKLNGGAVKIVDRLTFSHANFTAAKNWTK